jgi:hypothetical protein
MTFSYRNPQIEFRNGMIVDFEEELAGTKN